MPSTLTLWSRHRTSMNNATSDRQNNNSRSNNITQGKKTKLLIKKGFFRFLFDVFQLNASKYWPLSTTDDRHFEIWSIWYVKMNDDLFYSSLSPSIDKNQNEIKHMCTSLLHKSPLRHKNSRSLLNRSINTMRNIFVSNKS